MVARKARKTQELTATAFAFICGLYASPGSALEENGYEYIVNFDELPIGTTEISTQISNDNPGGPVFMVMGGEVIAGSPEFPAHSLNNVYYSAGGMISTSSSLGLVTNWPVIAAWVTSTTAAVTATFTPNPDLYPPGQVTETLTTVGFTPNQFLGLTDPLNSEDDLFAVSFSSDAPFAIDDLTYGAPNLVPGIPEPPSWALMLLGFGGISALAAGVRRRTLSTRLRS